MTPVTGHVKEISIRLKKNTAARRGFSNISLKLIISPHRQSKSGDWNSYPATRKPFKTDLDEDRRRKRECREECHNTRSEDNLSTLQEGDEHGK